jgi:hypothetical protein
MDSEIQKVIDESENLVEKEDVIQEGGAPTSGTSVTGPYMDGSTTYVKIGVNAAGVDKVITLNTLWGTASQYKDSLLSASFSINGTAYNDRPLLLSDLYALIDTTGAITTQRKNLIQNLFDNIPLAQYKHLPDPSYLLAAARAGQSGGDMDESTLPTQEVSLPPEPSQESEEQLPSLDIVEPSSTGGSYKWSSHKKRKSTRIRTKKNKNKK